MTHYDDEVIYPNQPLTDVASEVRFAGEMQVECERHRFWDRIRDDYPKILVPKMQEGAFAALQHYKFRSADGNRTVSVALNSLAFSETKYSGHTSFICEFKRLIGLFHEAFPRLGKINRVGWRYINVIPFSREAERVPVGRFLKLDIPLPHSMFDSTQGLDFAWSGRCLEGEVWLKVSVVERKDVPSSEGILLDIDYGQTRPGMEWERVSEIAAHARMKCRGIFEDMITDSYRAYLRGEAL